MAWNDVMLSHWIGVPLAEIRAMSPVDYNTYLQVLDAEHAMNKSILKKAG